MPHSTLKCSRAAKDITVYYSKSNARLQYHSRPAVLARSKRTCNCHISAHRFQNVTICYTFATRSPSVTDEMLAKRQSSAPLHLAIFLHNSKVVILRASSTELRQTDGHQKNLLHHCTGPHEPEPWDVKEAFRISDSNCNGFGPLEIF